ncbi:beta-propeller fold lactonase family protein [Steroidobacter sp. S1-65]|uniref:Beta-propeller fold lactonase family protein n=1 Tax=Steroidobacter gossypii TaxID=2805490 RepID=A0ABS1WUY0_9GAMM|nr:beta-propeller fold lactonase family protein [Steroidobacter gossypii]MBM0104775.1 beta-propeller fold lactonase family protein [Steroidobacter gossypii]
MSSYRHLRGAASLVAMSLLAACGGGGGGKRSTPPPSAPPPPPPPAQTYTLGGTVSGLSGSGLVLRSNTGEALPIDSNGAFTFPTAIASGAEYTIGIAAQPVNPAQTCVVSSGTGTVEDANVTNIAVNCTVNTFTVGGSVTGLSGSGLVLNNGREQVTVDSNGSFAFPSALPPGTSYDVAVDNAPANPAQRCVVSNGRGTVTAANVSDVTIHCETPYPSFAYALNRADGTMASFAIDAATGQLRAGVVTKTGHGPVAAVTYKTADGKQFRYVINQDDDSVSAFSLGARDGSVVEVAGSPFATGDAGPTTALRHPTRPFLYVPNESGSSIAAFRIDTTSGALTSAGVLASGAQPRWFVIEPSGRFAYAAGAGSELYTYAIDQTSGSLTEAPASRISVGGSSGGLVMERQGRYLYAFDPAAGAISAFGIDATSGIPAPIAGSPFAAGPNATLALLHPNGRFIYVKHPASASSGAGLSAFTIDAATGSLSKVQGSPFDSSANPVTVQFDPTGRYLYAGHAASGPSFNLRAYAVDTATGALTAGPGSPFSTPSSPTSLNVDASGNYLYVTHESSNQLSSYRIETETGRLAALPTSPATVGAMPGAVGSEDQPEPLKFVTRNAYFTDALFEKLHRIDVDANGTLTVRDHINSFGAPNNVAIDPLGRFLYVPDAVTNHLWGYSLDPSSGALTGLPGSPFAAGIDFTSILFEPQGRFAYVTSQNTRTIQRFVADSDSGALSSLASVATPVEASGVTIHPNGKYLYTSTPVTSGGMVTHQVQTYAIDPDTGTLTATSTEPAGEALSVVLDPSGRYAYVNVRDLPGVRAYSIDPQDGSLEPLAEVNPVFSPYGMAMDPAGKFLFVTRRDHGTVEVMTIQSDGSLNLTGSFGVGGEPIAATVDASGRWLYVTQLAGRSIVTFEIDRASGALGLKQITSTLWQTSAVPSPLTLTSYTQ